MDKIHLDNNQIPLHYQIADYLLIMLQKGDISHEEKLPTEEKLTEIFSVSRTTIRRALEHLQHKELLYKKQGKGTFWSESAGKLIKEKFSGINREIFNITEKTTAKILSKNKIKPESKISEFLNLPGDSEVISFERLRFINEEPISYTVNYLPEKIGSLISEEHLSRMTMLEALESVGNIDLGTIRHEVEITRANVKISELLKISVLDPVLTINTSVYDTEGNPIEIVWTYFVEDKYKFKVILEKETKVL